MVETVEISDAQAKARRKRSVALAVCLAVLVVVFYVGTLMKLGGTDADDVPVPLTIVDE